MAVKKKGSKWHPVGKSGKLWKTGYATEAKAKKALTQANKYFSSMKKKGTKKRKSSGSKPSKKKKTKKRKASTKKKSTGGGHTGKKKVFFNKNGIKLVAVGSALTLLAAILEKVGGTSAWDEVKVGNWGSATRKVGYNIRPINKQGTSMLGTATVIMYGAKKLGGIDGIGYARFN